MEEEDYPFPEEEEKIDETFNKKCRCPELSCPRHANCKECRAFHDKRYELTYCGNENNTCKTWRDRRK